MHKFFFFISLWVELLSPVIFFSVGSFCQNVIVSQCAIRCCLISVTQHDQYHHSKKKLILFVPAEAIQKRSHTLQLAGLLWACKEHIVSAVLIIIINTVWVGHHVSTVIQYLPILSFISTNLYFSPVLLPSYFVVS